MGWSFDVLSSAGGRRRSRRPRLWIGARICACTASLAVAGLMSVTASAGAASWVIQPTPNLLSGSNTANGLFGVSCTSASACTAVGWTKDFSTDVTSTLAEQWDGTSWVMQSIPNPVVSGNGQPTLSDVSCTSASACTAVGSYYTPGLRATLVERWDGTSWTIQPSPNPVGKNSYLVGVSCTSASACVAVGYYFDESFILPKPLAERWNGSTWALESVPPPSEAEDSDLVRVSCTSATACTGVGTYDSTEVVGTTPSNSSEVIAVLPLVEHFNGKTWSVQRTFSPADPPSALAGASVSCDPFIPVSPCVGLGSGTGFGGVSCASATVCTAVGGYVNAKDQGLTLAERGNSGLWLTQTSPNLDPADNYLQGVSCVSASACIAIGGAGSGLGTPFAEAWNGKTWTIQLVPTPSGMSVSPLLADSCTSAGACTAVGYSYNSTTNSFSTLAERYS